MASALLQSVASTISQFKCKLSASRARPVKVQAIAGDGARVDKFKKSDIM